MADSKSGVRKRYIQELGVLCHNVIIDKGLTRFLAFREAIIGSQREKSRLSFVSNGKKLFAGMDGHPVTMTEFAQTILLVVSVINSFDY